MRRFKPLSVSAAVFATMLSGCIDSKYDLSDLDKNVQISVNDLIVPIKIDEITLKSIISDDKLEVIDGAYAYTRSGDFTMSNISVPEVVIPAREPAIISIPITMPSIPAHEGVLENHPVTLPLLEQMTDYFYHVSNVTPDLVNIGSADIDCDVRVNIEIKGQPLKAEYTFSGVKLQLPDNITGCTVSGGKYDKDSKTVEINTVTTDPKVSFDCHFSKILFGADGYDLIKSDHTIDMSGKIGLVGGNLTINFTEDPYFLAPEQIELSISYSLGDIRINAIDGYITKTIDDVSVPPIDITDLPDVLAQPGTNLVLANPCLYMSVDNPLSTCNLWAEAGFDITSYHGDVSKTYTIDNPTFRIAARPTDNLCFSPEMPDSPDPAYPGCVHVPFRQLSDILSGYGLPGTLQVMITRPNIPTQSVTGFKLGYDYGQIRGEYKFVAPLQFSVGTRIEYSDRLDDWGEDVQKMTVTRLDIDLDVTTDVPMMLNLRGYPIDKNGMSINNVLINGAIIDANAQGQHLKISITGTVTGLDGIEFVATATAENGDALSPSMKINLSNIRPCITGYYTTEL